MRNLDVLIVGGGPAGLLAGRLLERHGLDSLVLEARVKAASPQSAHVHFFPAGCIERIEHWVPGFAQTLREEGCPGVDAEGFLSSSSDALLVPSRKLLDRVLRISCGGPDSVSYRKALTFRHTGSAWQVRCEGGEGGTSLRARWLIDASGQSRRTLRAISPMLSGLPVLHEGPAASHYLSVRVRGLRLPADRVILRSRGSMAGLGVLGLRLDSRTWQITVQRSAELACRSWNDLIGLLDEPLRHAFASHECCSTPRVYGGARSTSLDIGSGSGPTGWMAVGDALLCTPPYQGNGFANLISQLELLDRGLDRNDDLETIRRDLGRHAGSTWLQAALLDSLQGGCLQPWATDNSSEQGDRV